MVRCFILTGRVGLFRRVFSATIPLQVPAPLEPLVVLAAALPFFGSLVRHHMVILEILELERSAAAAVRDDAEREATTGNVLVLCDFEPVQKTSPTVALALLSGGEGGCVTCFQPFAAEATRR